MAGVVMAQVQGYEADSGAITAHPSSTKQSSTKSDPLSDSAPSRLDPGLMAKVCGMGRKPWTTDQKQSN